MTTFTSIVKTYALNEAEAKLWREFYDLVSDLHSRIEDNEMCHYLCDITMDMDEFKENYISVDYARGMVIEERTEFKEES